MPRKPKPRSRRRKNEPPPLLRHRDGRGFSIINGRQIQFGMYDDPETKRKHAEFQQQWLLDHQESAIKASQPPPIPRRGATINSLAAAYIAHCEVHYRRADGAMTDEVRHNRILWLAFAEQYGDIVANHFTRDRLQEFRERLIDRGITTDVDDSTNKPKWRGKVYSAPRARKTVNKYIGRIVRGFKWAELQGIVSESTLAALERLPDLAKNRSRARETHDVTPVPLRDLVRVTNNIIPPAPNTHIPNRYPAGVIRAMARLQYYIGCRPGELCDMTLDEISTEGIARWQGQTVRAPNNWVFQPDQHKNESRGIFVAYVIGPRARRILEPWLRLARRRAAALPRGSQAPRIWPVTYWTYAERIRTTCERLGVPVWSPNRLRHNYATRFGVAFDVMSASHALGHQSLQTTLGYFERRLRETAGKIERIG